MLRLLCLPTKPPQNVVSTVDDKRDHGCIWRAGWKDEFCSARPVSHRIPFRITMVVGALARLIDVIDGASCLCRSTQRTNPGAGHDDRWDVVNQHALAAVGRTMAPKTKRLRFTGGGEGEGSGPSPPLPFGMRVLAPACAAVLQFLYRQNDH